MKSNSRGFAVYRLWIFLLLLFLLPGCTETGGEFVIPVYRAIPRDESPTWSPDGRSICYSHTDVTHDAAYPTGLYVVDTGGHNRLNHTLLLAGRALSPDWSPDGRKIVFSADEIFTVTASGESLFQVTNVESAFFPSWSPDGERIVFATGYKDPHGARAIWIIGVDGSELHDISIHGTGEWLDPDWSPAGGVIVYLRYIGVGTPQVFEMDTSGTNQQRLTYNSDESYSPKWSPDGKSIAWARSNGIWLMNADGSQQRELIGNLAHDPCWSPDSRTIAFARGDAGPENVTNMVLWIVNADGSGLRQLTH